MIHTKEVKIRICSKNIDVYSKLGFDCKNNENIIVPVNTLSLNSRKIVSVECDNCGNIKDVQYNDYMKVFNKKNKYYCSNCKGVSIKDGVNKKYGSDIDNVFQLKKVKDQIKITCKENYGVDHHLQNKDILEKQKKTNQELYGIDFIPELKRHTLEIFVDMCKKVHGDLYDYSETKYIRVEDKVKIICRKHGEFKQRAVDHLRGGGCPKCKTSKGENFIIDYLNENNINYQYQKKFDDCKYKTSLPFDFYFPDMNMCLEFDGIQHFMVIENWGGADEFKLRKKKDKIKNKYCLDHSIRLERIKYDEDILQKMNGIFKKT